MPYVSRDQNGNISGTFANPQPGFATEFLADNDPAIVAFLKPPQMVASQDLIAQFTTADITTIQTAINSNASYALLWYAFIAQGGPMTVSNVRFQQGWQALVAILGQPRMTQIAIALNITM
jgi:hypothetical protein